MSLIMTDLPTIDNRQIVKGRDYVFNHDRFAENDNK